MKNLTYLFLGVIFGFVLTKGEAISWYRIQEMFHFQGFHMYGIFMTAVPTGALSLLIIKGMKLRAANGELISMPRKEYSPGVVFGSLIFGFGWALTGACPGPIYAQIGAGYGVVIVTLLSAILGAFAFMLISAGFPRLKTA